jgi:hypothetical protein
MHMVRHQDMGIDQTTGSDSVITQPVEMAAVVNINKKRPPEGGRFGD